MPEIAAGTADPGAAHKGRRKVYFEEAGGYVDCDTYERSRLAAGNVIGGPADHRADGHHDGPASRGDGQGGPFRHADRGVGAVSRRDRRR